MQCQKKFITDTEKKSEKKANGRKREHSSRRRRRNHHDFFNTSRRSVLFIRSDFGRFTTFYHDIIITICTFGHLTCRAFDTRECVLSLLFQDVFFQDEYYIHWIIMICVRRTLYRNRNAPEVLHARAQHTLRNFLFFFATVRVFCSSPFRWPAFNCNANFVCIHKRMRKQQQWTTQQQYVCSLMAGAWNNTENTKII